MTTSKTIRKEMLKRISKSGLYKRMEKIKKISCYSISNEIALDVVVALEGINVYKILKKEKRDSELVELKDVMAKFDFRSLTLPATRKTKISVFEKKEEDRSPYEIPLAKYGLDNELISDCKLQNPYRKAVSEALLTLETRMRASLDLDETYFGIKLVTEAKKKGAFKRKLKSEEDGLYFLYAGAVLGLRNPMGHRKIDYSKKDAFKIVLFTDYLLKLFADLINQNLKKL